MIPRRLAHLAALATLAGCGARSGSEQVFRAVSPDGKWVAIVQRWHADTLIWQVRLAHAAAPSDRGQVICPWNCIDAPDVSWTNPTELRIRGRSIAHSELVRSWSGIAIEYERP